MFSIPFPACLHLAFEHAEEQGEVAKGEDHTEDPPGESHGQAVQTGSCVVDCQVARRVGAGGKDYGIQCKGRAHEHTHNVECGSDKSYFVGVF